MKSTCGERAQALDIKKKVPRNNLTSASIFMRKKIEDQFETYLFVSLVAHNT